MYSSAFTREVTRMIRDSGAYRHDFFRACADVQRIDAHRLRVFCRSWYEVTRAFGLALAAYPGAIMRQLVRDERNAGRREQYERALQESMRIAAHDLGLGLEAKGNPPGPRGIHFNLFADMVRPIVPRVELERRSSSLLAGAARRLAERFASSFSGTSLFDAHNGAATLRVVEETAFTIVDAMLPLFRAAHRDDERLFTDDDLTYITLHRDLERGHASQSATIVGLVTHTEHQRKVVRWEVGATCNLFTGFWDAMYMATFVRRSG